ncbi:hypothetical protein EVAR_28716_1 [Eumeta japonica]|uniref:Uncharacterized protein n=1 Tax=Eumeta variegata TaxID=151549 RepID=A0A4C1V463_EUMVA|nr:hypothetical protein EVAR_28716_1 [Eumeta japonica]
MMYFLCGWSSAALFYRIMKRIRRPNEKIKTTRRGCRLRAFHAAIAVRHRCRGDALALGDLSGRGGRPAASVARSCA